MKLEGKFWRMKGYTVSLTVHIRKVDYFQAQTRDECKCSVLHEKKGILKINLLYLLEEGSTMVLYVYHAIVNYIFKSILYVAPFVVSCTGRAKISKKSKRRSYSLLHHPPWHHKQMRNKYLHQALTTILVRLKNDHQHRHLQHLPVGVQGCVTPVIPTT